MIRKEWFRPKKMRLLLAWAGAPLLFFYSNVSDASYRLGAILMIAGELIRLWSLGSIERKNVKLAVGGPYAFMRNPLYVGNFFLGLGLVTIVANWFFIAVFLIGFSSIYLRTIRHEEEDLAKIFGKPYEDYCRNVPPLFPRLTPYQAPKRVSFEWGRIFKHHEYVTVLGIALLLCGIHLYDEIFREKDTVASQTGLIIICAVIGVVLIFERLFISNFKRMFSEGLPNLFLKKKQ